MAKKGDNDMWKCSVCAYEYYEAEGVSFEKLSADWKCPVCNASRDTFENVKEREQVLTKMDMGMSGCL
jgi:rubredoxin